MPFSHSCDILPADAEDLLEAALGAAQAVKKKHGTTFTVSIPIIHELSFLTDGHTQTGRLCSMLYPAPGNILDWMYGEMGVKYSYAVHLQDTGTVRLFLIWEFARACSH